MSTALVTGAAGAIGAAIVRRLSGDGWSVIAVDQRSLETWNDASLGPGVDRRQLDVCQESDWVALAESLEASGVRVGALINAAGVTSGRTLEDLSVELWDRTLDVNLKGAFLGIRAVSNALEDGASIVSIGSTAGLTSHPDAAYSASKWGLRGLTRSAAIALGARGIRVNCVHPTVVRTELNAHQAEEHFRSAELMAAMPGDLIPEMVADAVIFLASAGSRSITGADIPVDAGYSTVGVARARSSIKGLLSMS